MHEEYHPAGTCGVCDYRRTFNPGVYTQARRMARNAGIPESYVKRRGDDVAHINVDRSAVIVHPKGSTLAVRAGDTVVVRPDDLVRSTFVSAPPSWSIIDEAVNTAGTVVPVTTDTQEEAPMDRLSVIKERMAELEREAASLQAIPDPAEWPVDTTISYERSYQNGNPFASWYTFVSVKAADGRWHTTGASSGAHYSDDLFRDLLAGDDVRNVFRATGWEAVAKEVEEPAAES